MTARRRFWASFCAAACVSTVVVTVAFNPIPHTGGDNAAYISLAHGMVTTGSYSDVFDPEGLPHTKYPPVFPGFLALLISLGARTWVALKMTAAVATVAAVGFTYLLAERSLGVLGALAVSIVLAFSSGVVYYSHWILSDPVFLMFTVAALFALARSDEDHTQPTWLVIGVVAAGLAYFTRSAGLPLIVALLSWLCLRRRWRELGGSALVLGVPMFVWWLRGVDDGVAQYRTEFWMVDPYQPALGNVGVFGLIPRLFNNLSSYVLEHGPAGVIGANAPALAQLGIVLGLAAVVGWVLTARERVGPAELFFPLYGGLILLWPEVWGGDRFALPLYPLVFLYGAVSLRAVAGRMPLLVSRFTMAGVFLLLLLPAGSDWLDGARQSSRCALVRDEDPWSCYGPQIRYFVSAARWTRSGIPSGAVVLSRKPRHFFVLSGHTSRTFPFGEDVSAHLSVADALAARYVLLDRWDGLAARYVGSAVRRQPGAFCFVRGFGPPGEGGAQLLGIRTSGDRLTATSGEKAGVRLYTCPAEYTLSGAAAPDYSSSGRIPLLEGLDS